MVRFDVPNTKSVFRANVKEIRERWKTNTKKQQEKKCARRGLEESTIWCVKRRSSEKGRPPSSTTPSEQERIEHEMTHLPFRSLCRHPPKEGDGRRTAAE